ncbi:MAG: CinA family protein [Gammaproteobacteria bacterium]|nr:CinA family protein [Gammaproteobacteria bacterium]
MLPALAASVAEQLSAAGLCLACAESCTGGWIGKLLTDLPGSSAWFERGFITYSNAAKQQMLGVDGQLIGREGAVSAPCALAMAQGVLANSPADLALAVTGIAGPDGGSKDKPLGTVFIAWARRGAGSRVERFRFDGDRAAVRAASVAAALQGLLETLAA